jgi:hypothetical protein
LLLLRNINHPDFPRDNAQNIFRESAPEPPNDTSRVRHSLAQSRTTSPLHPVYKPELHPVPRVPPPPGTVLGLKRKRASALDDDEVDNDTEKVVNDVPHQVEDEEGRGRVKRRMFAAAAGFVSDPPHVDPPTRENSPEPSSQPMHMLASPPSVHASQLQGEDSETERTQVIELLSQEVEQGGSDDEEEPTGNLLEGLWESQGSLPEASIADNAPGTSVPPEVRGSGSGKPKVPGTPQNARVRRSARGRR